MVCGGSGGLGAAVARQMAARGAHITIFARSQDRLDSAKEEIEASALTKEQEIVAVAVDLGNAEEASHSLASRVGVGPSYNGAKLTSEAGRSGLPRAASGTRRAVLLRWGKSCGERVFCRPQSQPARQLHEEQLLCRLVPGQSHP